MSGPGRARFHDVVTRKLTVALYQQMPGLEEPNRKRLLPVWVFWSRAKSMYKLCSHAAGSRGQMLGC